MATLLFRDVRLFGLAVGIVLVLGLSALATISRQEDPTITNLFATILTPYPGAGPARVEALVTRKIEEQLEEIAEIKEIRSTSREGISVVSVELSDVLPDSRIEPVWSEIRDALGDAARELPEGVPTPSFDNDRTGAYTAILSVQARAERDVPPAILQRFAERLRDRLRQAPETKEVRLFGALEEEVLVTVDARRLNGLGLTADDVSAAIAAADAKVQAGLLRDDQADLVIEVAGEIDSLDRIRQIPLRSLEDGTILRLADVAEVEQAVREPGSAIAFADGVRAVLVAARMEDDRQVDAWMAGLRAELEDSRASLPDGIEIRLLFDQSEYTASRLKEVGLNLAIGMGLVIAVLFVTLGWRAALVVAAMLPLTSLAALAVLQVIGIPVHQMSVTGLIVALGLLVDAAIVMTDRIGKSLDAGQSRVEAVRRAVGRLALPLFASTATTALAFTPMALLPGAAGDFVGSIAIAVIVMLTLSFLLALAITPALAGWLLVRADSPEAANPRKGWVARAFGRSQDLALAHPGLAILGALILPVIGFGAFPTLTSQFFPGVDRDQFYIQVEAPPGSSLERTTALAQAMEPVIRESAGIRHLHWVVGESAPSFYYNMIMDRDGSADFAEALVTSVSPEATEALIPELQKRLDERFPEARVLVRGLVQGPPVDAPVEIRVVGPDPTELKRLGEDLRLRMARQPGMLHVRETLADGEAKLVFDLDENAVRLAGLTLAEVARQLETALEGVSGGSLLESTEELPLRVRLDNAARADLEALRGFDVLARTPGDAAAQTDSGYAGVPLSSLGSLRLEPAESPITRRNGERLNTVQGFIQRDLLPEEVLASLRADLAANPLPLAPGYRIEFGGDSEERSSTVTNLISPLGMVLVLTVATIVITFRSYRLSLIAALVSFLSMGASVLVLAVFDFPFGIQALTGVIGSIGVSINAAIVILTELQANPAAQAGDRRRIADLVVGSGRHIISTTLTTFGGFLPLILAGGGFWPPFAMAIAGGVLLSTIVSFYLVPPMFLLVRRRRPSAQVEALPENGDRGKACPIVALAS